MTDGNKRNRPSLGFVGDVCLSMDVINIVRQHGPVFLFEQIQPLYRQFDLVIGNLECCITNEGGTKVPSQPPLNAPIDVAMALTYSNIDVFDLANNHVMDFGEKGLRSTLDFLNKHQFKYFGAGMTLADAEAPLYVDLSGKRAAFLGACDVSADWATPNKAGIAPMLENRLLRRVDQVKHDADLTVVVLHADLEFVPHPSPHRQRLSRRLIDRGADMVIQHHPHVCQGIERYKGKPIAYSLGNHVFHVADNDYQQMHRGTDESMLLQVDIDFSEDPPRLQEKLHPLRIDMHHRPVPSSDAEALKQLGEIQKRSNQVDNPRAVRAAWYQACRHQIRNHIYGSYYALRREGLESTLKYQMDFLRQPERRRWIYGLLSGGMI